MLSNRGDIVLYNRGDIVLYNMSRNVVEMNVGKEEKGYCPLSIAIPSLIGQMCSFN